MPKRSRWRSTGPPRPAAPRRLLAAVFLIALVALAARPSGDQVAGGQAPSTDNPLVVCAAITPAIVFVGVATQFSREVVTFRITEVREGEGEVGAEVDITYPTPYNAGELRRSESYLVAAALVDGDLHSVVQTADLTACGQSTKHPDGTRIDTGTLVGVREQLPRFAAPIVAGLASLFVVLVAAGRFLDRRSRYRPVEQSVPAKRSRRR